MTNPRWAVFATACVLVAAAGFGAGLGTLALFSDSETVTGSFSVSDDPHWGPHPWNDSDRGHGPGPWPGTHPWNGSDSWDGSDRWNGSDYWNGSGDGDGWPGPGDRRVGGHPSEGARNGGDATGVRVTAVSLADEEVAVGESASVSVTVANLGEGTGRFLAALVVDGAPADDESVALQPGENRTFELSHAFDRPGNYSLTAAGRTAGTVRVHEPAPDLAVTDASVGATTVAPGEPVTVTATVANHGTANGTLGLDLTADGEEVGTASATVAAGATETVTVRQSFSEPEAVVLAVEGTAAGTVEVVVPDGNETAPGSVDDGNRSDGSTGGPSANASASGEGGATNGTAAANSTDDGDGADGGAGTGATDAGGAGDGAGGDSDGGADGADGEAQSAAARSSGDDEASGDGVGDGNAAGTR